MTMAAENDEAQEPLATGTTNVSQGSQIKAAIPGDKLFFFQPATAEIFVCDAGATSEAVRREAALLEGCLLELSKAREELAAALQAYNEAQRNRRPKDDKAVDVALKKSEKSRDKLLEEFKELSSANKGNELMELLPLMDSKGKPVFGGKKFTYVRSTKIRSHFRSYKLSGRDDPKMKSFMTWKDGKGWQLDKKKLKAAFDTIKPKISVAEKTHGLWLPESWSPAFIDSFNEKLNFGTPEDKQSPDAVIAFNGEAHLLRFYGGASLSMAVDVSADAFKKALAGQGSVGAELKLRGALGVDLASGKLDANVYLPWRSGIELWIPAPYQNCTLGHIRILVKGELKGSCGASVLGEGGVEFKLSNDKRKQGLKGSSGKRTAQGMVSPKLNVKDGSPHATADIGGEVTAFAGAQGEASIHGSLQWQQPADNEFKDFASIDPSITAQAGIGGSAAFHITYEDGLFRMKAKFGACVGVGLKGEILTSVGAGQIVQFALWFKHQVTNAGDQNLEYFRKEAFEVFCKMYALAIVEGRELSDYIGMSIKNLRERLIHWRRERWPEFILRLQNVDDRLLNSIAEVKGILIFNLNKMQSDVQEMRNGALEKIRGLHGDSCGSILRAIQSILRAVYLRNELTNVFQHASDDGSKVDGAIFASMVAWVEASGDINVAELASTLKVEPTPGYPMVANNSLAYQMNSGTQIAWQRGTLPAFDDTRFV